MKNLSRLMMLSAVLLTLIGTFMTTGTSSVTPAKAAELCGNGSAPGYGLSYNLIQPHWTIGHGLVSEQAMTEVDVILDQLNADNIAQTMILILPADQVGIRPNCSVHFLRYMQLGQPEGDHKDNGFTFLIVVENDKIDVHYAVGLGLPALVASKLGDIKRLGESSFAESKSLDKALIDTIVAFDAYSRNVYQPDPDDQVPQSIPEPINQTGGWGSVCLTLLCLVLFVVFLIVAANNGWISASGNGGSPNRGGNTGSGRKTGGLGGGNRGGNTGGRGGSGSGRSGRTN